MQSTDSIYDHEDNEFIIKKKIKQN